MPKRKNTIRDLVGDAPALAPGASSEGGGFEGAVTAPGVAQAERQSLRQLSDHRETAAPASSRRATLKERARQMSLYLEPATYDALRDIAHRERTKMPPLLLQAVDQFLKKRVTPPE